MGGGEEKKRGHLAESFPLSHLPANDSGSHRTEEDGPPVIDKRVSGEEDFRHWQKYKFTILILATFFCLFLSSSF